MSTVLDSWKAKLPDAVGKEKWIPCSDESHRKLKNAINKANRTGEKKYTYRNDGNVTVVVRVK